MNFKRLSVMVCYFKIFFHWLSILQRRLDVCLVGVYRV